MNNEEKILKMLSELTTTVNEMQSDMKDLKQNQNQMQEQINNNHEEVMSKLDTLEKNEEAIKDFIINSDNTFRKSEEAYQFVQNVKSYFKKQ